MRYCGFLSLPCAVLRYSRATTCGIAVFVPPLRPPPLCWYAAFDTWTPSVQCIPQIVCTGGAYSANIPGSQVVCTEDAAQNTTMQYMT